MVDEEEVEDVVSDDVDVLVELVDSVVHTGCAQLSLVEDVKEVVVPSETGLPGDEKT